MIIFEYAAIPSFFELYKYTAQENVQERTLFKAN